jgi:hypothetical protein
MSLSFGVMVRHGILLFIMKHADGHPRYFRPLLACYHHPKSTSFKQAFLPQTQNGHVMVVLLLVLLGYKLSQGFCIGLFLPMWSIATTVTQSRHLRVKASAIVARIPTAITITADATLGA